MRCVRILSHSGPYFPAFGLNTEKYSVSHRAHSKGRKMRTRITPYMDTFNSVISNGHLLKVYPQAAIGQKHQNEEFCRNCPALVFYASRLFFKVLCQSQESEIATIRTDCYKHFHFSTHSKHNPSILT